MAGLFDQYPTPGKLIQVNDHHLHLHCLDHDGPTVLFEAGQAGFSLDWMLVQPEVSRFARTCAYDRAGLGWSEAGPRPRTPQQVVAELHTLLMEALVPTPYVLVAHSLGARYARRYAEQYPEDVLGLVLVDGYHEAFDLGLGIEPLRLFLRTRARQYRFLDAVGRLGMAWLFGVQLLGLLGPDFRHMPRSERKRYARLVTRPNAMATTIDEHEQAVAVLATGTSGALPKDVPLRILTHGVPWPYPEQERLWQESQRQAETWSSHSKLVEASHSGHAIMLAQPDLVIEAIRETLEEAGRSG